MINARIVPSQNMVCTIYASIQNMMFLRKHKQLMPWNAIKSTLWLPFRCIFRPQPIPQVRQSRGYVSPQVCGLLTNEMKVSPVASIFSDFNA